ncbi:MAG TPA: WD40 repeat domain-containing protein [Pirellulales bacterium]|nr:WD40 repeat domain-containing protein [Pirellulales bacterium]
MAIWSTGRARGLAMLPSGGSESAGWLPDGEAILGAHGRLHRRRGPHWDSIALKVGVRDGTFVAFSPDGKRLASGLNYQVVKNADFEIWELATSKLLVETEALAGHARTLAWSPDGGLLAAGAEDGNSTIYDTATGKRLGDLPATKAQIRTFAWSPDGKTIAAGYGGWGYCYVRLCDVSGKLVRELTCNNGPQEPEIVALHWSADGRTLQVLDRAAVYVFDTATGERLAEAPRLDPTPHRQRPANFSPDGRYLAVATTCTRVWDLAELNAAAEWSLKSRKGSGFGVQGSGEDAGAAAEPATAAPSNRQSPIQNPTLKLVASVVPLGHGQAVVASADGHWLGTRGAEKEIVYVIKTAAGQQTLTPREFSKRFG